MSAAPAAVEAEPTPPGLALRYFYVTAADGTRLRAWTNDVDGPTVLLCNGLGTNAYCWPALLEPDCGVRVVSWDHRGIGGSDRPVDPTHVTVPHIVADAVAVMDAAGLRSAPMMGWSIGVNTMFEMAVMHPERVDGLFAVAGVPGDTFASMLAPLGVPRFLRKPVTVTLARLMEAAGVPLSLVARRLPVGPVTGEVLTHSGFMFPSADVVALRRAVKEFLTTPVDWYMHLARHASEHLRVSLASITVPTYFFAGTYDVLAAASDMRSAAERTGGTYVELKGSHFLQLEQPAVVHEHLKRFLASLPADPR